MISKDTDASVVVVEDPLICRYIRSVLTRREVTTVDANAADAMSLVKSGDSKVSLVITNRPGEFLSVAGKLPVLYISSQPEHELSGAFRECRILNKPFGPGELFTAVSALMGPR
jgi:hypothetical protein